MTMRVLSPVQREMAVAAMTIGCRYAVVRDCVEAIAALDEWQVPRAGRVRL